MNKLKTHAEIKDSCMKTQAELDQRRIKKKNMQKAKTCE